MVKIHNLKSIILYYTSESRLQNSVLICDENLLITGEENILLCLRYICGNRFA